MTLNRALFGPELRRLRLSRGLSLSRLAQLAHYSKGYLSKIETGHKQPTVDIARRCDTILEAQGRLASLVPVQSTEAVLPEMNVHSRPVKHASGGKGWFQPVDRRQAVAVGAASVLTFGLVGENTGSEAAASVDVFRGMFEQFRKLGQTTSPSVVLPALTAQTNTLCGLAARMDPRARRDILTLGARYAEYAGWMAQESGDDRRALWWTDRAVELAAAAEDHDLGTYSLVRRALVALYRNDAEQTVELASQAREAKVPARIRGLAAQRAAQGNALAGDYDSCMRNLDRARELLSRRAAESMPVLGTGNLDDPAAMGSGWCLHDLGRPQEAADILDREVRRIPAGALRSQARYGARQALAHAVAGNVDHACALTWPVLDKADAVDSATIATDLRRMARTFTRFRAEPAVRQLLPRLAAALHHRFV